MCLFQLIDKGLLGIEAIPGNHLFELGMADAQFLEETFGRIDFAVLFFGAVGIFNRFGCEEDHFPNAGTYDDRLQDLVFIAQLSFC